MVDIITVFLVVRTVLVAAGHEDEGLTHAVLPAVFERAASDCVGKLNGELTRRRAAEAKAQSEAALARLATPVAPADAGLEGASAALAGLAYQRWADARRAEINQTLARQTHHWMEARDAAQKAFGKADALRRLVEKQGKPR